MALPVLDLRRDGRHDPARPVAERVVTDGSALLLGWSASFVSAIVLLLGTLPGTRCALVKTRVTAVDHQSHWMGHAKGTSTSWGLSREMKEQL